MDIKSGCPYPASALSNFAPHPFTIDGVECASMEGFLQSLKFKDANVQIEVCKLVGYAAKRRGKHKNWQRDGLWWRNIPVDRFGIEYDALIDRAYQEMSKQSDSFRNALLSTGDANLTHSIGRRKKDETILTQAEFCGRLMRMREWIKTMGDIYEKSGD